MKRIGAGIGVIVVALMLVIPSAGAQNGSAWLTPKSNHPVESAREVVLTVSMWRPSRVEYRTFDGVCDVRYDSAGGAPNPTCSDRTQKAHAPEDYTATSGELVFTEGGSKTITIAIVDDDLTEGDESFTLAAWEEANADPCGGPSYVCVDRSDSVVIYITDDEVGTRERPGAAAKTPTTTTVPDDRATKASPSPDLVALGPEDLRPGPGFELTSERSPEAAPERADGGGGSASGLVLGLGTAAVSVGALALVWRRRRWSPTRA